MRTLAGASLNASIAQGGEVSDEELDAEIAARSADQSGGVAAGEAFVREMRAKRHKLAALEVTLGRARPELRADFSSFPYERVFFRYVADRFEVVSLLEGHRNVETQLRGPGDVGLRGRDAGSPWLRGRLNAYRKIRPVECIFVFPANPFRNRGLTWPSNPSGICGKTKT